MYIASIAEIALKLLRVALHHDFSAMLSTDNYYAIQAHPKKVVW